MSGHRPLRNLTKKFSPERRVRVMASVAELRTEMALAELRQARNATVKPGKVRRAKAR